MTEITSTPRLNSFMIADRRRDVVFLDVNEHSAVVSLYTTTPEQAVEIAAKFPKSYMVAGRPVRTMLSANDHADFGHVGAKAVVKATGANGGVNESGIARIRKTVLKFQALGYEVTYCPFYTNSLERAEALALLGL